MLQALMRAFLPANAPLVIAADDTLERRRGDKISFQGSFRDPLLSSRKKSVALSALRWVSRMALRPMPWSRRVWALPFLTLLALHPHTSAQLGKRHKTVIDLVRQAVLLTRRWLPPQPLVLVTDGALIWVKRALACLRPPRPMTFVSRLHLNIRLFAPTTATRRSAWPPSGDPRSAVARPDNALGSANGSLVRRSGTRSRVCQCHRVVAHPQ